MEDVRPRRGLATARSVLHALPTWRRTPRACAPTRSPHVVGKSASTAYYLLASLVEEGFATHDGGLYRPRRMPQEHPAAEPRQRSRTPSTTSSCAPTSAATSASCATAGSRSPSCAAARASPACPASAPASPTTPTRWRWARWCSRGCGRRRVARYAARGLSAYTPSTITSLRGAEHRARARCASTATPSTARSSTRTSAASPRRSPASAASCAGSSACRRRVRAFDTEHDELASAVLGVAAAAGLEVPA